MTATAEQASLAGVTHHHAKVNGTELHYAAAGTEGTPILLVHGFPETWWTSTSLRPQGGKATCLSKSTSPGTPLFWRDKSASLNRYGITCLAQQNNHPFEQLRTGRRRR
jgi:hypothetical protein